MSIIPYEDKKKKIITLKYKTKKLDIDSRNRIISLGTKKLENIDKTINVLNEEIINLKNENSDLKEKLSTNRLEQENEHLKIVHEKYEVNCFKKNSKMQLIQCLNHIKENKCSGKCIYIRDYLRKYNLHVRKT